MIKNFRDILALILVLLILGFWIVQGLGLIAISEVVIGATISIFTLVAQFYFRKAKTE